jgi:hypothetical protein
MDRGPSWRAGQVTQLVKAGYFQSLSAFPRQFDVSPDGLRFLMIKETIDPIGMIDRCPCNAAASVGPAAT